MSKHLVGYYSCKAHEIMDMSTTLTGTGAVIYKTPSGEEAMVTAVYASQEQGDKEYTWPDAVCVGPVTEWVRNVPKKLR